MWQQSGWKLVLRGGRVDVWRLVRPSRSREKAHTRVTDHTRTYHHLSNPLPSIDFSSQHRARHKSCYALSPILIMAGTPSSSLPPLLPDAPSQSDRDKLTIFVSVVSYRDPETLPTLTSLLTRATHPSRIHVGFVWQYNTTADTRLFLPPPAPTTPFFASDTAPPTAGSIRQLLLSHHEARGPMYARGLAETLYEDETFYMQIDSHMRFTHGWDTQLINTLYHAATHTLGTRIILTGYPADYQPGSDVVVEPEVESEESINIMTATHFGDDGMLRLKGVPLSLHSPPPPADHLTTPQPPQPLPPLIPAYFLAAGFLFSTRALPTLLPTPLTFPGLFFGEELLSTVRAFTHGFHMYHCLRPVVRHCWTRSYRPSWRLDRAEAGEAEAREMEAEAEASRAKVRRVLARQEDGEGLLGGVRSVDEYWQWVGVDWHNKVVSERAQRGGVDAALLDRRKPANANAASMAMNDAVLQRIMAFVHVNR